MTFPLFSHGAFGHAVGLLVGTLVGMGFGFALERAGFGRARNLVAQFYLTDMRVLKVMFSAIVTALAGMALLGGIGLLDLSLITVPETFLWPQLAGGLILGAGFVVSGYCPGTAVVAIGSGNLDGGVALAGMLAGSLLFGFGFGPIESFYRSGAMGRVRLSGLLGVPVAVVAAVVVAMAIGAFVGGEKIERIFSARAGEPAPASPRSVRRGVFGGFAAAAALSLVALALPAAKGSAPVRAAEGIDAVTLARELVEAPQNLWVLDLRPPEAASNGTIPGAIVLAPGDASASIVEALSSTRKLVVYGQSEPDALPEGVERFGGEIAMLRGGYDAWKSAILTAPLLPASPTPALIAEFRLKTALHSRFTGAAATEPPKLEARPAALGASSPPKGGGC